MAKEWPREWPKSWKELKKKTLKKISKRLKFTFRVCSESGVRVVNQCIGEKNW